MEWATLNTTESAPETKEEVVSEKWIFIDKWLYWHRRSWHCWHVGADGHCSTPMCLCVCVIDIYWERLGQMGRERVKNVRKSYCKNVYLYVRCHSTVWRDVTSINMLMRQSRTTEVNSWMIWVYLIHHGASGETEVRTVIKCVNTGYFIEIIGK